MAERTAWRAGHAERVPVRVFARDTWMRAGLERLVSGVRSDVHLVCWLPPLTGGLAEAVEDLILTLRCHPVQGRVILLTRAFPPWLWRTLQELAPCGRDLVQRIQVVTDRLAPAEFLLLLSGRIPRGGGVQTFPATGALSPGLSAAELRVLGATLRGEDMRAMAACEGLAITRLYRLRWQAMEKLGGARVKNLRHARRG